MADHIVKSFDQELNRLKEMVETMGRLTCEQLKTAVDAVEALDRDMAKRVIEREPQADRMEHEIDRLAIRVLTLRQPVAIDLRQALSAQRIANELERICDYAEDLAERCIGLRLIGGEPMAALTGLGRFAVALVEDAMAAYAKGDTRKAQEVWTRDKELDEMYSSCFGKLIAFMTGDSQRTTTATHMLMMARALERAGDRATNIAEDVRYLVEGTLVEEERPKANATKGL
ncbi:MAG: phosphate signaling complex protein PhoU [Hyphomicrobiaceae bacterium]|nr:MAG: phosphate signaling complex protein PhoU [Hyphomicrobiaceae bacterium]